MYNPGDKLINNKYTIIKEIGSGSYGIVYLVKERYTDRKLALKRILDKSLHESFKTEMKNLVKLENIPHILPFLTPEYDEHGILLIVTQYMNSGSLFDYIQNKGPLSEHEAVEITRQIAFALNKAHEINILHKDVKPENIFGKSGSDETGKWYLGDWGLAEMKMFSKTVQSVGTLEYMAPELSYGKRYPESDIYALGCTLYYMLFGNPPFTGSLAELVFNHIQQTPQIPDALSDKLKNILSKMLSKQPRERISAYELLDELSSIKVSDQIIPFKPDINIQEGDTNNIPEMLTFDFGGLDNSRSPIKSDNEIETAKKQYENGDYDSAHEIFKKLAVRGEAEAMYYLGLMYLKGQKLPKDSLEAYKWFCSAAEKDNIDAQAELGAIIIENPVGFSDEDREIALKWLEKATEKRHPNANYYTGYICRNTYYLYKNDEQQRYLIAFKCFRIASEKNHSKAKYELSKMFKEGTGVKKDEHQAEVWLINAGEDGVAEAQYELGRINLTKEKPIALKWLQKAAIKGNESAENILKEIYQKGDALPQDTKEIEHQKQLIENSNNAQFMYNLANTYEYGYGCSQDINKAIKWYVKSACKGKKESIEKIIRIYKGDNLLENPEAEIQNLLSEAQKTDSANLWYILGKVYHHGLCVAKNYSIAIKYYKRSLKTGANYSHDAEYCIEELKKRTSFLNFFK